MPFKSLVAVLIFFASAVGCRTGPRDFRDVNSAAPLLRARAAGLDGEVPDQVAIPDLIRRLDDRDAVVRLSAHERLRGRTGVDLGYVPWAEPAERAVAVERWRAWWVAGVAQPIRPSAQ